MNERIRELAEQAKEHANQSTKDFTGDEPVVWMDYYTEKFAELIVRECTNIVLHYADVDEGVAVAKKHFGVEE